jgi:cysteinyl-tRNA synthetase
MRLYDTRRQAVELIEPAVPGRLLLDQCDHTADIRCLVLTDVFRRTAELEGLHVRLLSTASRVGPTAADRAALAALNIRPADDVLLAHQDRPHRIHTEQPTIDDVPGLGDIIARGLDPLALRLVCIEHHYRDHMDPSWASLGAADRTLTRWREQVSNWATHPSRAMPRDLVSAMTAAVGNDLDTPRVLALLRELETSTEVDPGAAFEVVAYIDRILALDLTRRVGVPTDARY